MEGGGLHIQVSILTGIDELRSILIEGGLLVSTILPRLQDTIIATKIMMEGGLNKNVLEVRNSN